VKAKLMTLADGVTACLVVDEPLDDDKRQHLAEWFGLPEQLIFTVAQYKEQVGKEVHWLSPLPALTPVESVACAIAAQQVFDQVEQTIAQRLEQYKATHADAGKRGAYVTARVKAEISDKVWAETLQSIKPDVPAEEWQQRLRLAVDELKAGGDLSTTPQDRLQVWASLILKRQYQKKQQTSRSQS
jgi:hypothetical protein